MYKSIKTPPAQALITPAWIPMRSQRLGGDDIGHHLLAQGVDDRAVQSLGDRHHHEGLR
jgi:hypothetical protein